MARSAADLSLGLDVLAGPDELSDGVGYKLALPPARHKALKDFRILLLDTHPLCPTSTAVRRTIDALAERLSISGCSPSRSSTLMPDLARTGQIFTQLLQASLTADLPEDILQAAKEAMNSLSSADESLEALRLRAMFFDYRQWRQISIGCAELIQKWRNLFNTVDVVLCPVTATPAFPHDHEPNPSRRRIDIDGEPVVTRDTSIWASIASIAGLPATVAPIGFSETGLPIGIQIIGPYLEDRTTISFAQLMERDYGGFTIPGRSS